MADPMWALVMFDLPVKTKRQRRDANKYRLMLRDLGFSQVQLSVYSKFLVNATGLRRLLPTLRQIPPKGRVRILRLTDDQWATTMRFYGSDEIQNAERLEQLLLFDEQENAQARDRQ